MDLVKAGWGTLSFYKNSQTHTVEQVYLDCVAKGGRSTLDAIAIELEHSSRLGVRGKFDMDGIIKVQDDLQVSN